MNSNVNYFFFFSFALNSSWNVSASQWNCCRSRVSKCSPLHFCLIARRVSALRFGWYLNDAAALRFLLLLRVRVLAAREKEIYTYISAHVSIEYTKRNDSTARRTVLKWLSLREPRDLWQMFVRAEASVAFCRPASRKWTRRVPQRNAFPAVKATPIFLSPLWQLIKERVLLRVPRHSSTDGYLVLAAIVERTTKILR